MPEICELHFQEGFSGQEMEILLDDQRVAQVALKTRLQIGLAEIIKIPAQNGQKLTVVVIDEKSSENPSATAIFDRQKPYLAINLVDGLLTVCATDKLLGYL